MGLCERAAKARETIQLVWLSARAVLVCRLTGLEKAVVNRLYRQIHGQPSPSGQAPFTDAWYLRDERRMLHATLIWRLYRYMDQRHYSAAKVWIDVYASYASMVKEPLLDINRAIFVPRLVAMEEWHERVCMCCKVSFLAPVVDRNTDCPGCKLYHRYRCRRCNAPLKPRPSGRRRRICDRCKK